MGWEEESVWISPFCFWVDFDFGNRGEKAGAGAGEGASFYFILSWD
jgi:hypothetical protein